MASQDKMFSILSKLLAVAFFSRTYKDTADKTTAKPSARMILESHLNLNINVTVVSRSRGSDWWILPLATETEDIEHKISINQSSHDKMSKKLTNVPRKF